ncbi:TfoX/Sxy family protein [Roseibium sp.]|uniref:TfoX/Sxy family protein n=1 Tax=Roseibium sp. TaxID=1936156 RepID=UPI003B51F1FC
MPELMEEVLIERIGDLIPEQNVERKRMFGATCFMVNGNMLVCASKNGLMARVGKDQEADALAKPYASLCRPTGQPMPGFIEIAFEGVQSDEDLKGWIDMARTYVCTLPVKVAKAKKSKATAS